VGIYYWIYFNAINPRYILLQGN